MFSLLYIDDEPGLLEIGQLFLESTGEFRVTTALSGDEGLAHLAKQDFDAIVSDYQMPGMDGIELLKKVRKTVGNIPFVLFTGRGREEVVIQAINNGVDFYLQKGGAPQAQFAELAHKLRQAIGRRRAETALSDSEQRLADIINFLPDATFAIDRDGHVISWNRAIEEMTGIPASEMLGKGDHEYAIPFYGTRQPILIDLIYESDEVIAQKYSHIIHEKNVLIADTSLPKLNGRPVTLMGKASPLYNRQGEIVGAIESIRDITQMKTAEERVRESEKRFRELADLLPQGIYEADVDGRIRYVNRIAQEMFGYTMDDLERGLNAMTVIAPENRQRAAGVFRGIIEQGARPPSSSEYWALRKDGSRFPVSIFSSPIFSEKGISGIRGVIIDITERKNTEEELAGSREYLDQIYTSVQAGIVVIDVETHRILDANPAALTMIGAAKDQIVGKTCHKFICAAEDSRCPITDLGQTVDNSERVLLTADGRKKSIIKYVSHIRLQGRDCLLETFIDNTPRKRAEEELRAANEQLAASSEELQAQYDELATSEQRIRESEQKYRTVFETTGTAMLVIDEDSTISLVNGEFARLSGYPRDEIENRKKWAEFVHQDDLDRMLAQHRQRRADPLGALPRYEFRFITRSGEIRYIFLTIDMVPGTKKSIASLLDITETKKAADEIQAANEQLVATGEELRAQYEELALSEKRIRMSETRLTYMLGFYAYEARSERELLEYAIEGAGVVTGSSLGYLAFLNDDESELSMYAWSKSAMTECSLREKPLFYKTEKTGLWGEAVRQRRPVITNDYAAPDPAKKGYPEGHPQIIRHMNVPVIDDGHIVLVAGVANKPGDYTENDTNEFLLLAQGLWTILKQKRFEQTKRESEEHLQLALEELQKNQQQLEEIAGTVPGVVYQFYARADGKRGLYYVSGRSKEVLGLDRTPEDFFDRFTGQIDPRDREIFITSINRAVEEKTTWDFTGRFIRPSGGTIWIQGISRPFVRTNEIVFSGLLLDITERKRAEDELRLLKISADRSSDEVFWLDFGGNIRYVNDAACRALGYSSEEFAAMKIFELDPDFPPQVWEASVADLRERKTQFIVTKHRRKDGSIMDVEIVAVYVNQDDREYSFAFVRDITERKRMEVAIRESEEKYRSLVDIAPMAVVVHRDGNILYTNPECVRIIGAGGQDDLIGKNVLSFLHPDDRPAALEHFRVLRNEGSAITLIQQRITTFSGEERTIETTGKSFTYQGIPSVILVFQDITGRKHTEEALFNSQQMLQAVLDSIPQRVFWKDRDSVYLGCNLPLANDAGYADPGELVGKDDYATASKATADLYRADDRQVMETGQPRINYEEPQIKPDGSSAWLRTTKVPLRNKEGAIIGVLGTYEDITSRKLTEHALRENEEQYRTLVESSFDGIAIHQDGILVYVNRTAARLLGSENPGVFIGKPAIGLVAPAYRHQILERVQQAPENSQELIREQFLRIDGTLIDVDVTTTPSTWKERPAAYVTFRDITAQLQAEVALRESEEKYRELVEHSRDGVFIVQDSRLVFYNRALVGMTGYTAEDLNGRLLADLIAPEDRDVVMSRATDRAGGKSVPELYEFSLLHKDGVSRTRVRVRAGVGTYRGRPASTGTFYDVTEDRRREKALRESEEKFRALVETTSDFIWEVDADGVYTYVSPKVRDMLGYEPGELVGKTPFAIMPPDEATRVAAEFSRCAAARLPIAALENKVLRKDGSVVILETNGVVRTAEDGRYQGYRGIDRDITKRKQAEEALRESEARASSILHGSPVLQFVIDRNHRIISWNKALEEYSGINAADIIGTDQQWRAFYADKRPVLADLLVDGDTDTISHLYTGKFRKSGYIDGAFEATDFFPQMGSSGIWLSFTAAPVRNGQGAVIGAVETLEDVTEQKSAENALRESEEWTRTILNTAQAGIVLVDAVTHQIVDANKKALQLIGLERGEVIGVVCHRFICPAEEGHCPVTDHGQNVDTSERVLISAAGEKIPVLKTVVPVSIHGRSVLVESFVDISEQKRSEVAIREASRKLNLLNSITRHDIRNQLMVAQGYTQLASLSRPDATITDFLAKIGAAIETIQRQIEFTKTYQELGVHAPAWFPITEIIGLVRPDTITLHNTCKAVEIFADPMIDKVFFNLFDNAVKHGSRVTEVTVGCGKREDQLVITFADNGCGIPHKDKKKIFEKGYGKNTGLGLFLAREILAITGITIHETGIPGEGAIFEIIVPEGTFRNTD